MSTWPSRRKLHPSLRSTGSDLQSGLSEGWFENLLLTSGFLHRHPRHAGVIARMDAVLSDAVPYMAVGLRRWDDRSGRVRLLVNPEFVRKEPQLLAGVLLHEVHHVVLGHLFDLKFHSVSHPLAMEVAMELSANENVHAPLPKGLLIDDFAKFGIQAGQSTMERYRLLADAVADGRLKLSGLQRMSWDRHRLRQAGTQCIGPGDLIDARSDRARSGNWNRHWGLGMPSSSGEIRRMRALMQAHLGEEFSGDDGGVEATQRRVAKELPRPILGRGARARLDWPRVLREVFLVQRQVHPDYKRPNRRFPERVGELPGRTRRPPRPHLLAAIDTSGSMDLDSLQRSVDELRQLLRHARLSIVQSDAAVRWVRRPQDLELLTGGGDTDFAPVFDELPSIPGCNGVVYFTDGRGEMPTKAPGVATLWVLNHDRPFDPPFGSIVRLIADD